MGKKLLTDRIKTFIHKYWIILFILGTGVYFVSCVVINFIGKPWYNIDMYSDALVAELMADEMTLFPSSWTFGNQYYVVATPVLGAVFYKFIGDSFYAMALASSVMMAVIYLSYWWCLKPFLNKKSLAVGLFVLSGGIIFGTSSCEYQYGFQIFYTMASYYACYIVGVFLTLGLSLRIYTGMPFHKIWFPIVIVMNFALGMQSLRETLILNIPLVIISLYLFILKKCHYKENIFFSVGIFLSNFSGIIVIKILVKIMNIKSYTIISKFSLRTDIQQILEHFFREIDNLFKFTGLYFVYYIKVNSVFIIIFLGALLTVLSVILSVAFILVKKDTSPLAIAVLCCFVSVISVFGVGVLFFENRIIYYFIWYILSVLSVCYFLNRLISKKIIRSIILIFLLLLGTVNYYCNFYIDFVNYYDKNKFYNQLTQDIAKDGVNYIYLFRFDWNMAYPVYAYSNGAVQIGSIEYDEKHNLLKPMPYLKYDKIYDEQNMQNAYIVFRKYIAENQLGGKENFHKFFSRLEFVEEKTYSGNRLNESVQIYKAKGDIFYRGSE